MSIFNRNQEPIDAGAELDRIEGERGAANLGSARRPLPPGAKAFMVFSLALIVILAAWLITKAFAVQGRENGPQASAADNMVRQVIPKITAPVAPDPDPMKAAAEQPVPVVWSQPAQAPAPVVVERAQDPEPERRYDSPLRAGNFSSATAQPAVIDEQQARENELTKRLQPIRLNSSSAAMLADRDYLLTEGSTLDCVLATKMVSTQPGMTVCHLPRDVYSANGRVVLLDRGTKFVGFYDSSLKQGQERLFVQWRRAETPKGVVIALDSPGTGPLGEAGVGGHVDNHFWQRFGGTIMLSLIGDVGQAVSNSASNSDSTVRFDGTARGMESAAAEALRNSINIPPTLTKNPGERVAILVARDLDFSSVYAIQPTARR